VSDRIDLLDETDFVQINRTIVLSKGEDDQIVAVMPEEEKKKVEEFLKGESRELILTSSIQFEFASDFLDESSHSVLNKISDYMKQNASISLLIEGHTDNVGPAQYNLSLSKRRAQAVEDYLIKQGVKKSRFETKGYGMQQPRATNDTSEGRALNRRVVFSVKE
jgi:OOP family OmpA-OmpF porin